MLKLFDNIAKFNSPADKVKMLLEYPYQEELKEVLQWATDPFITFGITSVDGNPLALADTFKILKRCADRTLTGGEARRTLGEACLDEEDQEVITRILRKDLRCGLGEKLVLQAYPGLIRQFSVMRAYKFDEAKPRLSYAVEPKYDGLRCVAIIEGGSVNLISRNGLSFTSSDHLKPQLLEIVKGFGDCVIDGELVSGNFNESSSAVRKKAQQDDSTNYHIFDIMDMDEWKTPAKPYYQRRQILESLLPATHSSGNLRLVPSFRVISEDEIMSLYNRFLDLGYEGAIVKNVKGLYRKRKHRDWMKLKEVNDVDLRVESLVQGEGKYHGMLGAVIVKFKNKRVSVGSGFSDEERELYWKEPNLILHKVIEIHYHEVTPDGSLRHPRVFKIREDKS